MPQFLINSLHSNIYIYQSSAADFNEIFSLLNIVGVFHLSSTFISIWLSNCSFLKSLLAQMRIHSGFLPLLWQTSQSPFHPSFPPVLSFLVSLVSSYTIYYNIFSGNSQIWSPIPNFFVIRMNFRPFILGLTGLPFAYPSIFIIYSPKTIYPLSVF